MAAAMLGQSRRMRSLFLAAAAVFAVPAIAQADPASEAASAVGACISAIVDGAPVADQIKGEFVEIRREKEPETCTVSVTGGEPAVVRARVLDALAARKERFSPAKTRWDAGAFASREAFCNLPSARAFNVIVSTARPGEPLVLTATVLETQERDLRCDRDEGVQKPPAG